MNRGIKFIVGISVFVICCVASYAQGTFQSDTLWLSVRSVAGTDNGLKYFDSTPVFLDKNVLGSKLGIPADELTAAYDNGLLRFQAIEPSGALNSTFTANAPGHWFRTNGYVTGNEELYYVFSELNTKSWILEVGQFPYMMNVGDRFTFRQALTTTKATADGKIHRVVLKVDLSIVEKVDEPSVPVESGKFCIENVRVNTYINDVNYTSVEDASVIDHYNIGPVERRDHPAKLPSGWTALEGERTLINLYPGQSYSYRVMNGGVEESQGTFTTVGQVRMIEALSVPNIRDLGGWRTVDGHVIQYGLLYRGSEITGEHNAKEADKQMIRNLGIKAILDLRNEDELARDKSCPLGNGITYRVIPNPVYYYNGIHDHADYYAEDFKYVVQQLRLGKPLYFNCIWGCDRTGTLAFLLEGTLGLSYSDLCKEYELSSFSAYEKVRKKDRLTEMYQYILGLKGETLRQKFVTYWTEVAGVSIDDIRDFRCIMLGMEEDSDDEEPEEIEPTTVEAAYVDASGTEYVADAIPLESVTSDFILGKEGKTTWYVVSANTELSGQVLCHGNVNLIIVDGCKLTVNDLISLTSDSPAHLTIYGQSISAGMGSLNANAGIEVEQDCSLTMAGCNVSMSAPVAIVADGSVTVNGGRLYAISTTNRYSVAGKHFVCDGDAIVFINAPVKDDYLFRNGILDNNGNVTVYGDVELLYDLDIPGGGGLHLEDGSNLYVRSDVSFTVSENIAYYYFGGNIHVGEYVIDDDAEYSQTIPFVASSASYTRQMANTWGTLVLPFNITVGSNDDCNYYMLKGASSDNFTFRSYAVGDDIPAGTPLVITKKTAKSSISVRQINARFSSVILEYSIDNLTIGGSFQNTVIDDDDSYYYYVANNKIWRKSAGLPLEMKQYRAWFYSPREFNIRVRPAELYDEDFDAAATDNSDATGIAVIDELSEGRAKVYDLNGRESQSLRQGINIIRMDNGKTKKVIVH